MAHNIDIFVLLCDIALILLKSLIHHGYSQSDCHLICLADIQRSYLIYFQMCNMLKILHNRNRLKHCISHCKMLHLVFPDNNQYLISWEYLSYRLVAYSVLFFFCKICVNKTHSQKSSPQSKFWQNCLLNQTFSIA